MGLLSGLAGGLKSGLGGVGAALGMRGGGGGLLGGLGGKLQDFLGGTGAELAIQDRPDIEGGIDPTTGQNIGPMRQMPQITETKAAQPGLLERMRSPDGRGLTFADKLFAAGSVMQGDSGGAATYINNQRAAADQLAERDRGRDLANKGLEALRGAIDPETGQLNVQKYLAALPAGVDPKQGLDVREALMPNITPMSGPRGSIRLFDRNRGRFQEEGGIEGEARQPELFNPDGSINQQFIAGKRAEAEAVYGGRRAGAPPVFAPRGGGRGGGGGGKARKPIPSPGDGFIITGP